MLKDTRAPSSEDFLLGSVRVPPGTEPLAEQLGREVESVYTLLPPHTHPTKKPCRVCLLSPSASRYNISKHLCVSIELQKSTLTSSADMLFSSLSLLCTLPHTHTCCYMNGDEGWYLSSLSLSSGLQLMYTQHAWQNTWKNTINTYTNDDTHGDQIPCTAAGPKQPRSKYHTIELLR